MFKTPTGELSYKFHGKDEAKILGSMDSEEKLVLDRIKDSANEGSGFFLLSFVVGRLLIEGNRNLDEGLDE